MCGKVVITGALKTFRVNVSLSLKLSVPYCMLIRIVWFPSAERFAKVVNVYWMLAFGASEVLMVSITGTPPSTTILTGILLIVFNEAFLTVIFTGALVKPHVALIGASIALSSISSIAS